MTNRDERWQRVEQLCGAALHRSGADRAAFLREACGDDEELRREVDGLLAQESAADAFLNASVSGVAADVLSATAPLLTGQTVYGLKVGSVLGVGGMGQVYRARDAKLGRDVAMKVLLPDVANDPERLARFKREAQILASLNHPNIAAIYGLEDGAGTKVLILELVEGPTLADRIARGAVPLGEALLIARQIADALEAAHEQGIIHRDLKPANIKVRSDGTVKVLDFGLAKIERVAQRRDLENSPTMTSPAMVTGASVILGTAAYMAPEQARGGVVDKRVDIWAFGCVLYEMVTGRLAFPGDSVSDTIAAILREEPDWSAIQAAPRHIERLIRRCLEKDARRRLRDIGDTHFELVDKTDASDGTARGREAIPRVTLTMVLPKGLVLPHSAEQDGAPLMSPDGTSVLLPPILRRLHSLSVEDFPVPLFGQAFWSPDSKWAACPTVSGQLRKVRVAGGHSETIAERVGPTRGGAWSERDTILLATGGDLLTVPAAGGTLEAVDIPGLRTPAYQPEFIAGGDDFLFWSSDDDSLLGQVFLATLRGPKVVDCTWLMNNETGVRYTPAGGGGVVFVRNDNLVWQKLNQRRRTLEGDPLLIELGAASSPQFGFGAFSVSRAGVVAWRPGSRTMPHVTIFDRQGNAVGTVGPPGVVLSLRLSPDGSRFLAESERGGTRLLQPGRTGSLNLGHDNFSSLWSSDGTQLIGLTATRSGRLTRRSASGAGPVETLDSSVDVHIRLLEDLSPDGTTVLFTSDERVVACLSIAGDTTQLVYPSQTQSGVLCPRFSPDGRWIVYSLSGDGLYVQPFPGGSGLRQQISDGGCYPVWRRDGREIVYFNAGAIWSIGVGGSGELPLFAEPVKLFSIGTIPGVLAGLNPLAITPDGSRIFFPRAAVQPDSNLIHLSSGWAAETSA